MILQWINLKHWLRRPLRDGIRRLMIYIVGVWLHMYLVSVPLPVQK